MGKPKISKEFTIDCAGHLFDTTFNLFREVTDIIKYEAVIDFLQKLYREYWCMILTRNKYVIERTLWKGFRIKITLQPSGFGDRLQK